MSAVNSKLAQALFRLRQKLDEMIRSMAYFHDAHADAIERCKLFLGFFQNGQRHHSRAGAEIVDSFHGF